MWNSIVSVSDRYLFIYFDNYVNVTLFIMLRTRDGGCGGRGYMCKSG